MVGRVLMDSVVHFPPMRNLLANLWRPLGGISITDIRERRVLFQFYSMIDLKRVIDGVQEVEFGWDNSLKALPRRTALTDSQWLREEVREGVRTKKGMNKEQEGRMFEESQTIKSYGCTSGVGKSILCESRIKKLRESSSVNKVNRMVLPCEHRCERIKESHGEANWPSYLHACVSALWPNGHLGE
ncbi:hypothetical protein PVK06_008877 [Gossypium arboreum]|uniref:DUF4283 domain-containing protein n=1 Tax=Gossypium arboreum TaxID=29729 RepID=A0ABR0QL25_GOSAR|nr:hypothetical protein PVK06_008877 [Gossypium arboreum]